MLVRKFQKFSRRGRFGKSSRGVDLDQIPHPMITRRDSVTNARNPDTTFKIVLSGKRN